MTVQYAIRIGGYVWQGDSVLDAQHLETLAGARKMVANMVKADRAAGVDSPRRFIVSRNVSPWKLVEEGRADAAPEDGEGENHAR